MRINEIYQLLIHHERNCISISVASLLALVTIHLWVSIIHIDAQDPIFLSLSIISFILAALLSLIVITRGLVPIVLNFLGIVLIYGSIIIPAIEQNSLGVIYYKAAFGNVTEASLYMGAHGLISLGIFMILMGVVIGYKPSILYARNRPQPVETFWSRYPIWKKELEWMGIKNASLIRLSSMVSEKEQYLLWRYQYVLTSINETLFLVPVNSFIPSNSIILREESSRKIIGVDKYMSFFA